MMHKGGEQMKKKKKNVRRTFKGYTRTDKILHYLQTIGAIFVTALMMFPIYWIVKTALVEGVVILDDSPNILPTSLTLKNFVTAWNKVPLWRYILNTVVVTVIVMFSKICFGTLAAYGFARGKFPGRDILFYLVLGAMMIPTQCIFIPVYTMMAKMGLINTLMGLAFPNLIAPQFIYMLRQSFKSVDQSYIDAGRIDGLGTLGSIWHVMVPMCKATLITVSLNTFVSEWNNYFWPKIIAQSDAARTVTTGLVQLRESFGGVETWMNYNVTMAGTIITLIPAVAMFFCFQKYMLQGYAKTAMK